MARLTRSVASTNAASRGGTPLAGIQRVILREPDSALGARIDVEAK